MSCRSSLTVGCAAPLIVLNRRVLPTEIGITSRCAAALGWAVLLFGVLAVGGSPSSGTDLTIVLRSGTQGSPMVRTAPSRAEDRNERGEERTVRMRTTEPRGTGPEGVADRLVIEFDGTVPPVVVRAVVRDAEAELRGQVSAGALQEMLHRLAGQRLRERAAEPQ